MKYFFQFFCIIFLIDYHTKFGRIFMLKIAIGLFVGFTSGMFASRRRFASYSYLHVFIQCNSKRSKSYCYFLYTTNGCNHRNFLWKRKFYKLEYWYFMRNRRNYWKFNWLQTSNNIKRKISKINIYILSFVFQFTHNFLLKEYLCLNY